MNPPSKPRPTPDRTVVRPVPDEPLTDADRFLSPPRLPDEVGRLGPYRVLGVLGRGGMGAVYRAHDPRLDREVAVKVLLPDLSADPRAKARFRREAQAQAKVDHDNIIPIHEVEEADGVAYIVMPLLKGQTLGSALKQNPRPPVGELVRIGREMADGLAAAHAVGLIHRDIKPANVWLEGPRRRVRVLDFGLCRGVDPAAGADADGAATASGAVMGTPAYMSPEQARGQPVDGRTDLFSLGVVLYQMATGRRPFVGASAFDVMAAVVSEHPPAVAELVPDVPRALSDLIARLLAKDAADRPQSAEAVADELAAIGRGLVGLPVQVFALSAVPGGPNPWADIDTTQADEAAPAPAAARPGPRRVPGRWLWPAAGLVGAVAVAALVWLAVESLKSEPKPPEEPVAEQPKPPATKPKDAPVVPPHDPTFFNGNDLTGWVGDPAVWKVEQGEVVGTRGPEVGMTGHPILLYTHQVYADFQLSFSVRIRVLNEKNPVVSGLHFGGQVQFGANDDATGCRGPVYSFGGNQWGTMSGYGTPKSKGMSEVVAKVIKPGDYNAVTIRRVKKVATITINGTPAVPTAIVDFERGVIAWSVIRNVGEVRVRDIRFTDLSKPPAP